jgi:hypothetical protein
MYQYTGFVGGIYRENGRKQDAHAHLSTRKQHPLGFRVEQVYLKIFMFLKTIQ